MILILGNSDHPSTEELWLIGEIWRVGRGANLTIISTRSPSGNATPPNSLQIQVKSNSGKVRVKSGREVEEVSLEEFPAKLENNEFNYDQSLTSVMCDSQDATGGFNPETDHVHTEDPGFTEASTPVHYILSNPKSERPTNPILREKAMKALKQVTTATTKSAEILIHELPREIIAKMVYEPAALTNNQTVKMNEEQRDQVQRMNQFISGGRKPVGGSNAVVGTGRVMVLYNHKDNQTDLLYMK